jgi:hypothetical protein
MRAQRASLRTGIANVAEFREAVRGREIEGLEIADCSHW